MFKFINLIGTKLAPSCFIFFIADLDNWLETNDMLEVHRRHICCLDAWRGISEKRFRKTEHFGFKRNSASRDILRIWDKKLGLGYDFSMSDFSLSLKVYQVSHLSSSYIC